MDDRSAVGAHGEDIAARYLEDQGLQVLTRNWRCRAGELDIIAADGDDLVVVEVKTRRTDRFGPPQAAVTRTKLLRLRRLTALWLAQQERSWAGIRLDVVAVTWRRGAEAEIEHLRAVG